MQILILKPSSLGDIVCSLPVARSIRDQMPSAVISWVVKDRYAEIVRRCPAINGEIIEFQHAGGGLQGLKGLWQTIRLLQGRQYDAVLDFQGLARSALMTAVVKSPLKIGSPDAREGSRVTYHRIAELPPGGRDTHATERLLQFLPELGLKPEITSPNIIRGDSPDALDSRLASVRPVVMIPNSRGPEKEWPGFPQLTTSLLEADSEATVVWDSHLRWDSPATKHSHRFINLTQRTSLLQMIEVLRRARLVIANDSGPLHIAAALGIPTLGLFGPTSPKRTGPYPLTAAQNNVLASATRKMADLKPADVLAKTLSILRHRSCSADQAAA